MSKASRVTIGGTIHQCQGSKARAQRKRRGRVNRAFPIYRGLRTEAPSSALHGLVLHGLVQHVLALHDLCSTVLCGATIRTDVRLWNDFVAIDWDCGCQSRSPLCSLLPYLMPPRVSPKLYADTTIARAKVSFRPWWALAGSGAFYAVLLFKLWRRWGLKAVLRNTVYFQCSVTNAEGYVLEPRSFRTQLQRGIRTTQSSPKRSTSS